MCTSRRGSQKWLFAAYFVAFVWLGSFAFAADGFVIVGEVPAVVPDGAVVEARVVGDAPSDSGVAVASAPVEKGRFELHLPPDVDPALLETDRLGCEPDDTLELGYLPHLTVVADGEVTGRLVLTDMPRELWSFPRPPKHAYFLYTPDTFAAEGTCRGAEIAVSFAPGWNPVLVIQETEGMSFTSEPAPEGFVWKFAPSE